MKYLIILLAVMGCFSPVHSADMFDEHTYIPLISDRKAAKVGDALTVMIVENTRAETRANSALDNNLGLDARLLASAGDENALVNLGLDRQGGGISNRQTNIAAQLTAVIHKIDQSGNLHLEGDQIVNVNGEEQRISVKGWARAEDISSDNVVLSNRLGNARIEIIGDGDIADANEPGWVYKFFSFLGII